MTTAERTTVVIATRNRAGELLRTLHELCAVHPPDRVIVVDNASTDSTAEGARSAHSDVRLARLRVNAGALARNVGVSMASTPYVAFSDDDSWWAPGALARAEAVLDDAPDVGLLAARTLVGPANRPDPVCAAMANSPLEPGRAGEPGPPVLGFLACSAVVRRSAFLAVGGFSPLVVFGAEERLLALDLAAGGWALCYVDEVVAHHHPSRSRASHEDRRYLELRNGALIALARRHARAVVREVGSLVRAAHDPVARRALAATLRRAPGALTRRRPVPPHVEAQARLLEER